jgi:hypothetical protein
MAAAGIGLLVYIGAALFADPAKLKQALLHLGWLGAGEVLRSVVGLTARGGQEHRAGDDSRHAGGPYALVLVGHHVDHRGHPRIPVPQAEVVAFRALVVGTD